MEPTDKRIPTVEQWEALKEVIDGAGGVKVLTTDDYNYHVSGDVDDGIALWKLGLGFYYIPAGVKTYVSGTAGSPNNAWAVWVNSKSSTSTSVFCTLPISTNPGLRFIQYQNSNGLILGDYSFLKRDDILDVLSSYSTTAPLSANQGRILNNRIGDLSTLTTTDKTSTVAAINELASSAGGGNFIELSADNYDYPTNNPDGVAMWKLSEGSYKKPAGVKVYITTTVTRTAYEEKYEVKENNRFGRIIFQLTPTYTSSGSNYAGGPRVYDVDGFGSGINGDYSLSQGFVLTTDNVQNNLTTPSSIFGNTKVLAAYQGKVLKDLVDSLAIRGAEAPTTSTVGQVGTLYEDTTNGDLYICTDATNPYVWEEVGAGGAGGGGIIELTSADYNYDLGSTGTNNCVAMWTLDAGIYSTEEGTAVIFNNAESAVTSQNSLITVSDSLYNSTEAKTFTNVSWISASAVYGYSYGITNATNGNYIVPMESPLVRRREVSQSAGNNNALIMSQNAVTSMVFADPSTRQRVQIGSQSQALGSSQVAIGDRAIAGNANSNQYNIAIGRQATASGGSFRIAIGNYATAGADFSVALGATSSTSVQGEVSFGGSSLGTSGYNNSQYRLLTNVYDPQSAHDAATKGYVDPSTDSSAPTTSTVGRLGEIRIDTSTSTAYMCVSADDVTPAYEWRQITA